MFSSIYIRKVVMKLLIAGSRSINEFDLSEYISDDVELIISGGAQGIDTIAENYADKHKISKLILRPNYKRYGKAAPLIRNEKMVDICDSLIVVWDGKSNGTKHTIEYAQNVGKSIIMISVQQ